MTDSASVAVPQDGAQIGPFRVIGALATGGMGVVVRGQHVETGQIAAVKTALGPSRYALDSIRREIHALSRLEHPGVVRILDHGTENGSPWYAMQLLEGVTLRERLRELWRPFSAQLGVEAATEAVEPRASEPRAPSVRGAPAAAGQLDRVLSIVRGLCQTLEYLHGEGVVHRDLKPGNVVLREGDLPVLVDFGIFQRFAGADGREVLDVDATVAGTLDYIAPEQLRGQQLDARADLYALGCILFEALAGRPPFLARPGVTVAEQVLREPPPRLSQLVHGAPEALEELLLQLLAKDPTRRPGHADDVSVVLARLGASFHAALSERRSRAYLYRSTFVGQTETLDLLVDALTRAREGHGQTVLLSAPSGAGKTRLALELCAAAARSGFEVVTADCAPTGVSESGRATTGGGPLAAFRPLLRLVADRCRKEGPGASARLLGPRVRVLEEWEPLLATTPGRDQHPSPPLLAPRDAGERSQRAALDVLTAWCAERPTLFVMDDIQWADDLSLGALSLLLRDPPERLSALVLLTCRSEAASSELDGVRSAPRLRTLTLPPLRSGDVTRIAAGMMAMRELPPDLEHLLVEESAGSPLFVSELLKAAVSERLLVRREGRWGAGAEGAAGSSSSFAALRSLGSLESLIVRRLAGLDAGTRDFLAAGAVWGRQWSESDVSEVAELDEEISLCAAETLLQRQVLTETDRGDLRFVHDRVREAAYAALDDEQRQRLHGKVAHLLESRLDGQAGPAARRALALHYRRARVLDKAFRFATTAGEQALAAGAFHEAARDLQGAHAIVAEPGSPVRLTPLEQATLSRGLVDALYAAGDIEAMGLHAEAGVEAGGVLRMPTSERDWARRTVMDLATRAATSLLPARLRPRSLPDRELTAQTGYLLSRLSEPYIYSNRPLAFLGTNLAASRLAEAAADSDTAAWVHGVLGVALSPMRLGWLARRLVQSARVHAERTTSVDVALYQAQIEAYFWSLQGEWQRACSTIDAALAHARDAGAVFRTEQLLIISTIVHNECGDLRRAELDARTLRSSAQRFSHELCEAFGQMMLGLVLVSAGEVRESADCLFAALRLLDKPHLAVQRANCHAGLAAGLLLAGDLDGALAQVEALESAVPDLAASNIVARAVHRHVPWVHLAALHSATERRAPTTALARRAEASLRRARLHAFHVPASGPVVLRQRAALVRLQGRPRKARALLEESAALARSLRMPLEEALAHLDLSEVEGADRGAQLRAARTQFSELHCHRWVALIDDRLATPAPLERP